MNSKISLKFPSKLYFLFLLHANAKIYFWKELFFKVEALQLNNDNCLAAIFTYKRFTHQRPLTHALAVSRSQSKTLVFTSSGKNIFFTKYLPCM